MNPKESLPKDIISDINELSNSSLRLLLEELLNRIMKSERETYLLNNQEKTSPSNTTPSSKNKSI